MPSYIPMTVTTRAFCGLQTSQTPMAISRHFVLRVFILVLLVHHLCFMPPYGATSKTLTQILQEIRSLMYTLII